MIGQKSRSTLSTKPEDTLNLQPVLTYWKAFPALCVDNGSEDLLQVMTGQLDYSRLLRFHLSPDFNLSTYLTLHSWKKYIVMRMK